MGRGDGQRSTRPSLEYLEHLSIWIALSTVGTPIARAATSRITLSNASLVSNTGRYTLFGTAIRGVMAYSDGVWCPEINLSMIAKLETSIPTHIHHLTPATGVRAQALAFSMDMAPHVPPSFLKTLLAAGLGHHSQRRPPQKGPCHQAAAFPSHRTQQVVLEGDWRGQ
jgi:hypothetical protein